MEVGSGTGEPISLRLLACLSVGDAFLTRLIGRANLPMLALS